MMLRSFWPVGQGAFYCECFKIGYKQAIVIYDCGSSSGKELVNNQIEKTFKKGEPVDAVFISHLDGDHVNGLEKLLKYCNVKKIFLPLMTKKEKTLSLITNIMRTGERSEEFSNRFIRDPQNTVRELESDAIVIGVRPLESEDEYPFDERGILSGSNLTSSLFQEQDDSVSNWEYIPFNFRNKDRAKTLEQKLLDSFGSDSSITLEDILAKLQFDYNKYMQLLRNAYDGVPGSLNVNSLVLYSGTKSKNVYQTRLKMNDDPNDRTRLKTYVYKPGCLYMGDYDANGSDKWRELENAYLPYWETIDCIQIPHHGSKHNYNDHLAEYCELAVISASKQNYYRHPHKDVLKSLLFKGRDICIVTEDNSSFVDIIVN